MIACSTARESAVSVCFHFTEHSLKLNGIGKNRVLQEDGSREDQVISRFTQLGSADSTWLCVCASRSTCVCVCGWMGVGGAVRHHVTLFNTATIRLCNAKQRFHPCSFHPLSEARAPSREVGIMSRYASQQLSVRHTLDRKAKSSTQPAGRRGVEAIHLVLKQPPCLRQPGSEQALTMYGMGVRGRREEGHWTPLS